MRPYRLLSSLLSNIETHLDETLDMDKMAASLAISSVHMQRLFKFAFGLPLAAYVRSRKLSASLEPLLNTGLTVLDIANEFAFEYEQSYIRAFKREFGLTPGELRKTGAIVKVTPPLQLFESNRLADGVFFGPEIVMVPAFTVVGRRHRVPFSESVEMAPRVARDFWDNERQRIEGIVCPDVYIGLTRIPEETDYSFYMPSIQVRHSHDIPDCLETDSFKTSLCARFRYIGQHHYYDINAGVALGMYNSVNAFASDKHARYDTLRDTLFFERIDTAAYDGTYCQMEWFTPVLKKAKK